MVMSNKAEWDLEGQCWKQPPGEGFPSSGEGVSLPPSPLGRLPGDRLLFSIMAGMAALLLLGGFVLMVAEFGEGSGEEETGATDSSEEDFEESDMEDEEWFAWEDEPDEDSADEEETAFYSFDWYEDSEGFALYVPEGWDRSTAGAESGVTYTSTDDERYLLQVMWDQGTSDSSMEVLERRVHNDVSQHGGYEEIRLKETSDGDAEFEYVYDHGTHGPRRVMVTAFDLDGSTTYMVLSVGPEYDGDAIAEVHDEAVSSFCDEDDACRGTFRDLPGGEGRAPVGGRGRQGPPVGVSPRPDVPVSGPSEWKTPAHPGPQSFGGGPDDFPPVDSSPFIASLS